MPPLTTIRPTVPEPEITAGGLADPLGDLAAPTHLKIEQYLPGDVLGGAHPAPRLSWEIASAPAGWAPTGADLEITRTDAAGTPLLDDAAGLEDVHAVLSEGAVTRMRSLGLRD